MKILAALVVAAVTALQSSCVFAVTSGEWNEMYKKAQALNKTVIHIDSKLMRLDKIFVELDGNNKQCNYMTGYMRAVLWQWMHGASPVFDSIDNIHKKYLNDEKARVAGMSSIKNIFEVNEDSLGKLFLQSDFKSMKVVYTAIRNSSKSDEERKAYEELLFVHDEFEKIFVSVKELLAQIKPIFSTPAYVFTK